MPKTINPLALPVLLIILAFFLFGLLIFLNQSKYAIGQALQYFVGYQCFDSDGGPDQYTAGYMSSMNGEGQDYCTEGETHLQPGEVCDSRLNPYCWQVEHYCYGNIGYARAKSCPTFAPYCIDGECVLPRNEETFLNDQASIKKPNRAYLPYYKRSVP